MPTTPRQWFEANRRNWDERVALHLKTASYEVETLRKGEGRLNWIEEQEIGSVDGLRVLHLQCHFGRDSLMLAQRGATVVGIDFSGDAIQVARELADDLGLAGQAKFVQSNLYDAKFALAGEAPFDLVYVTWGALCWLPDIKGWAEVVSHFLKPGGELYLAEQHPASAVLDDTVEHGEGPVWFWPYFSDQPLVIEKPTDYVGDMPEMESGPIYEWIHPLGDIVTALSQSNLTIAWLREHPKITWEAFPGMVQDENGLYGWPDKPWLPLSFSLRAVKV